MPICVLFNLAHKKKPPPTFLMLAQTSRQIGEVTDFKIMITTSWRKELFRSKRFIWTAHIELNVDKKVVEHQSQTQLCA
jgi:hypothetical protein